MSAKSVMVIGTGSNVGKSIICTGLCRIFQQDGWRVSPFKAQNMALNSYVTLDGKEIGRSQGIQAEAAGVTATVQMNPVLLKPSGEMQSQVILLGKPLGEMSARQYRESFALNTIPILQQALTELGQQSDLIVMEGAGSPVEVNLKDRDIVNMRSAELAQAAVVLVADIDRGGVFASVTGTLALLSPAEREMVKGIIINKFRGDLSLFTDGVDWLESHTGKPVLGVIPHLPGLDIDAEDSLALEEVAHGYGRFAELQVAVVHLPHISNFTDITALQHEPDTAVYFVSHPRQFGSPDLVVVPGSKNTLADLQYLRQTGLADQLLAYHQAGGRIVGICGGYQLLGREIVDELQVESTGGRAEGLGLLDVTTHFAQGKTTVRSLAETQGLLPFEQPGELLKGYEIHMGETELGSQARPWLRVVQRSGQAVHDHDGAVSVDGRCFGTYWHGLFDNSHWRRNLINWLRQEKSLPPLTAPIYDRQQAQEQAFNRLATHLRQHLNLAKVYEFLGPLR